ncbi:uncharacterized protein [Littorina saxatilis]|uniref:Uncharacterized protein n=1 Tax=Littorina saxatilis TaxID=31220 RepID=A0AAN9GPS0_9CAEN
MTTSLTVQLLCLILAAFFCDLPATHGALHVIQSDVVMQDQDGHWSLELRCGNFAFLDYPAFDMEWQVPSERTVIESRYKNGHFTLRLSAPVEGGNYTCRIPTNSCDAHCLQENGDLRQASLHVDDVEARLMLLEAQQAALEQDHDVIKDEHTQLRESNASLTTYVLDLEKRTKATLVSLSSRVSVIEPVIVLNNLTGHHIAFHATHLKNDTTPHSGHITMKLSNVLTNQGGCYNTSTGFFMTPFPGTYFFAATTGSYDPNRNADFALIVEGIIIAYSTTRNPGNVEGQVATAHGIVHLKHSQKVFIRAMSQNVDFFSEATSFSGFLLYPDPPNSTAIFPWPG